MSIHHDHYGTNAMPPETLCAHLLHDLGSFLKRHEITPDERLIKRILFRRGIGDEADLIQSYGREMPYAAFMRDYRTEINKVHLP